jgi:hypothetical protein
MAEAPGDLKITNPANRAKLRYHDRPDLPETFTDSIRSCMFDGQNVRIEFTVGRFEDPGALGIVEGKQVPVCRLVLSAPALVELLNRLGQVTDGMRKAGILKVAPPAEAQKPAGGLKPS